MEQSTLVGYSILVVEEEPFVARCVQVLLEGAGAEVHSAGSAGEALHFVEHAGLSAAVLDYRGSANDCHRIPQRLAALGLPFVFCKEIGQDEASPAAPSLNKPVRGAELVAMLCRLLQPGPPLGDAITEIA